MKLAGIFALKILAGVAASNEIEVGEVRYATIQAVLDAHPARMILVPAEDYRISNVFSIDTGGSGHFGPGRIFQADPEQSSFDIRATSNVRWRNLTLTRPNGKMISDRIRLDVLGGENASLIRIQVIDNQSGGGGIVRREWLNSQIANCLVQNGMAITIDDCTAVHSARDWVFAFRSIDGIIVRGSEGTMILGNRVIERNNLRMPEIKVAYGLEKFTRRLPKKGLIAGQKVGEDHCAFIEMKAMDGSSNVLIIGNQVSKNDLWTIGLMPGAALNLVGYREKSRPQKEANVDAGYIVANNIIPDSGSGNADWASSDFGMERYSICLDAGQKLMNSPLRDLILSGNVAYDPSRDGFQSTARRSSSRHATDTPSTSVPAGSGNAARLSDRSTFIGAVMSFIWVPSTFPTSISNGEPESS